MKYNFDEVIDRSHNRAAKYDERMKKFGREDVIPLWVADMDFRTAEPIIDALKERAEEGIWGYTSRPDSYFEAIRGWQKRRNGWDIKKEMMSWSLGVVPALSSIVKLFSEPGEHHDSDACVLGILRCNRGVGTECAGKPTGGKGRCMGN